MMPDRRDWERHVSVECRELPRRDAVVPRLSLLVHEPMARSGRAQDLCDRFAHRIRDILGRCRLCRERSGGVVDHRDPAARLDREHLYIEHHNVHGSAGHTRPGPTARERLLDRPSLVSGEMPSS